MTENTIVLQKLEKCVSVQDKDGVSEAIDMALKNGVKPSRIQETLLQGLDRVRKQILSNNSSLPELLISLDLTTDGLKTLKKKNIDAQIEKKPISIVIGVVEGDPHDLGKNIISLIYKSYGYRVIDIGAQVPKEVFVRTVVEENPEVLALSAMMSTTMSLMPEIIKEVKTASPDTLVMIGGAPLDEKLALSYGADGYAESAVTVIEQTRMVLEMAGNAG
jgi:5-methyltetrahydrofolate--homocysteine methyltransferase